MDPNISVLLLLLTSILMCELDIGTSARIGLWVVTK